MHPMPPFPQTLMFTDKVTFKVSAGKGGNGVVAWRREKYLPKGGPTGGNGGDGGTVTLIADPQVYSLEWFRHKKHIRAENGRDGGASNKTGRRGTALTLKVPCGTLVKDLSTGELLIDLTEAGQSYVLCEGGKGGRGNESFKSPTNRAPTKCTAGTQGQSKAVELELKLIADVGLLGFPNAGKSTLISRVTKVEVKVAPYPFTTLRPNLGYIEYDDFSRILIADVPGIICGANEDKGLGLEFLRHVERTEVLVYMLDASGVDDRDPLSDFKVLRDELKAYNAEMLERPFLVALNKCDIDIAEEYISAFKEASIVQESQLFVISSLSGEGVEAFMEAVRSLAQAHGKRFV